MKMRVTIIVVLTALAGLLIGCEGASANSIQSYDTKDSTNITTNAKDAPDHSDDNKYAVSRSTPTSYFTTVRKYGDGIEWLSFSLTDYQAEREIVRQHFARAIAEIEASRYGAPNAVKIAIAQADINGDSQSEIICLISHRYFIGAKSTGLLGIFICNDGNWEYIRMPQVWLPISELGIKDQREVGIRDNPTSEWKDFFLNSNLWRWSGDRYRLERVDKEVQRGIPNSR